MIVGKPDQGMMLDQRDGLGGGSGGTHKSSRLTATEGQHRLELDIVRKGETSLKINRAALLIEFEVPLL